MASGARLRSDNEAFGRARSGTAFLITAQPPTPPPATNKFTYPWSGIMDDYAQYSDDPSNYCPGYNVPIPFPVDALSAEFCRLRGKLHARNFPVTLIDCDGADVYQLPSLACIAADPPIWGNLHRLGDYVWAMADGTFLSPPTSPCLGQGEAWRFQSNYQGTAPPLPAVGSVVGYRINPLDTPIQEYDVAGGRVRLLTNHYWKAGMRLDISGGSVNDGQYPVTSIEGDWLVISGTLQAEAPARGLANNIIGQWHHCGAYTAISNPAVDTYPARIESTELISGLIQISGTVNYNGIHLAEVESGWSRLPNRTWVGDEIATGTFVDDVGVFTSVAHGWRTESNHSIKIVSDGGLYTGTYLDAADTISADVVEVTGVYAAQADTGTLERPGVRFWATNMPAFGLIDITISGTGLYDGTYRVLSDPTAGYFYTNDARDTFYLGDATGTWAEVGNPGNTGSITQVTREYNVVPYSSVVPNRGGAIDRIVSSVIDITAPAHDRPGTGRIWLHPAADISWVSYPLIDAPDGDSLIAETDFTGTAAGQWTARDYD